MWIHIEKNTNIPLMKQLYSKLRKMILKGELLEGERLPSTRLLSNQLHISRNVVLEAYDQLIAEGFLVTKQGAGTFVAEGAYFPVEKGTENFFTEEKVGKSAIIDFRSGIPDLSFFPRKTWSKLLQTTCLTSEDYIFNYGNPEGHPVFRQVLSRYLKKTRGVCCHPNQIVVTSGATQALSMLTKLLLTQGDKMFIEDPITKDIQTIFSSTGATLYPIPVDKEGMQTHLLPHNEKPACIFVTPSHQFPLGSTLPIQRRIELLAYAKMKACYIIEDDYDSEFRYEGTPVPSLQGLDPNRVIYVGSFSKILSPGLRLGYLVLPPQFIEQCKTIKWFTDLHTPCLEQLVLANFIEEGYLERHIYKMKKIYKKRRDCLLDELEKHFSGKVTVSGSLTGLHVIAHFNNVNFSPSFVKAIHSAGVRIYPVETHSINKGQHYQKLIIGFGHLTESQIKEGVSTLHKALSLHVSDI